MSKTIFVAGIHGVGKTYLCESISHLNFYFTSASTVIKKELTSASWDVNKTVRDADKNQAALLMGLEKIRELHPTSNILLDGHFVLRSSPKFINIDFDVFSSLRLDAVILVEDAPEQISQRISQRDGVEPPKDLTDFLRLENSRANEFCQNYNIPIYIVKSGDKSHFDLIVNQIMEEKVV